MPLRNTIQRKLVLETVHRLHCHATADQVFQAVRNDHPTISRATVYRNLNVLAQEGKIRRLAIANGPDCFDHVASPHYHIRCTKCGQVVDVDPLDAPEIENHLAHTNGFLLTGHELLFHGICPECHSSQVS